MNNLKRGQLHHFRIIAENEYGQSDPCVTKKPVKICDVPSAPGRPEVKHQTENSVRLEWSKTHSDGGSKVLGD